MQGKPAQDTPAGPDYSADRSRLAVGDNVRWKGRAGQYRRDVGDNEHCEILLGSRVYSVPTRELE